jgi:thiamine biosynthesis lipoprotein
LKTSIDRAPGVRLRRTLNGATMGTRYSAVFYAPQAMETEALAAALFEAVDRVDRQMSNWNKESDLSRLNAAAVGEWVALPRELMTVLAESLRIGRATGGAFDIGVGDLVAAWGFGPRGRPPDPDRAAAARAVTTEALVLNVADGRACKSAPLSLDLCGIAKGFGVDEMARVMDAFDIRSWLVGIDGEMRARGAKPDGGPWAVAHERPDRHRREAMGVIELTDTAVATSGSYRHWIEVDGRLLSHTIDPATGLPLESAIASVSVLAPTCMAADAWATALLVLGAEAGIKLAETSGMGVIIVFSDGTVRSTI